MASALTRRDGPGLAPHRFDQDGRAVVGDLMLGVADGSVLDPELAGERVDSRESLAEAPVVSALVMIDNPAGAAAEAVRALRTHIMAQHIQEGRRALALCAATPGVGCSFIAANLTVALSQIGMRTLLIDGDVRTPSIGPMFGVSQARQGLAECLTDPDEGFGRYIQPEVRPALSLMTAGALCDNPQELLAGERFKALVEFCQREFDVTLVDTPPADICSDARRISTVTGYSLVVAQRDATRIEEVKSLAAQLAADHACVVGAVLNEGGTQPAGVERRILNLAVAARNLLSSPRRVG